MATNWKNYNPLPALSTLKQLDGNQKLAILNDFSQGLNEEEVRKHLRIPLNWAQDIYKLLRRVNTDAIIVQHGEFLEDPGFFGDSMADPPVDSTPPVYNSIPANASALLSYMQDMYDPELSANAVGVALTEMVKWSNGLGDATYTYWKEKVTK